jgi:hypothetical protein
MSFLGDFWCAVKTLIHVHSPKISDFLNLFAICLDFFIQPGASTPEFGTDFSHGNSYQGILSCLEDSDVENLQLTNFE